MERPSWLPHASGHYLEHRREKLAVILITAAFLQMAAGVGLAYVAGFGQTRTALGHIEWEWLIATAGALALSFLGYYYACQGVYTVDDGPGLSAAQMRSVVIAGFGGFLAHGGSALDKYALEAGGADGRDADVRVAALAGMEHGVLGLIGSAAAIAVLAAGYSAPGLDFSLPWAIIPVPGFLAAFWLAERHADRYRACAGWKGKVGVFLDSIRLVRHLFEQTFNRESAVLGMTLFWAAEMFAVWAGMAAFGFEMNGAQLVLGVGTGMVFTRRTGPLAGAGVLMLCLPLTIWYSGAPLAVAVVGVFAYRVLSLWLPLPFGLVQLPRLREMGNEEVPNAESKAGAPHEPALPDRKAG